MSYSVGLRAILERLPAEGVAFKYYKDGWQSISYKEFLSKVYALASILKLEEGQRVAILSENRYEWCSAFMAIVSLGLVAVPIDPNLEPEEIKNILLDSDSKAIFVSPKTKGLLSEIGLRIQILDLGSSNQNPVRFKDIGAEHLACLVYTSGTTGRPKAVMLTHGNLTSDIEAVLGTGIITKNDRVLSILPLNHTYALMCTFLAPISVGATIVYPESLKGPDLIRAMKETAITILIAVPRVVESLRSALMGRLMGLRWLLNISKKIRQRFDINIGRIVFFPIHRAFGGRLRYIACGGARLEPSVMLDMEGIGFTIIEGYGLTETSPVVTFNPPSKRKPGSVGKPLSLVEIKILNPTDTGEGEIVIKGPMVMSGYYKNPEATKEALKDGWLLSGDLGYMDNEGYLYITGRAKDIIVLSSGKNIYPDEVEREYQKIPLIKEICVFGKEDRLEAVIVPDTEYLKRQGIANIREALSWEINSISRRLPPYKRLMGYTLYPEPLPKTPLGKFRRFMIKELISKKPKPPVDEPIFLEDETAMRVAKCIKSVLKEQRGLRLSDNLELDLGIDSLGRLEVVSSLEAEFSVRLPEGFASEVQTIKDIVSKLKEFSKREAPPEQEQGGLVPLPFERLFRRVLRSILRVFFKTYGISVSGLESLPKGAFIIAANHASYLDGFVLASSLPKDVYDRAYFLGFQRYFRGTLRGAFARLGHVISIDPDMFLGEAMGLSQRVLREGNCLVIFPEGGRSFDGSIMPFKKGIGVLALRLSVPVVPVCIEGTYEILPRGARLPKMARIRLSFGSPILPEVVQQGEDIYQQFADKVREEVAGLCRKNN